MDQSARVSHELFQHLVSSYRVDFQLCTEEAIQEALEELRLRGIELVDISEATGANDASSVESSIRQLHELSPGLEFFIDSRSFIRYAEQLVSAVILVADKPQICDMAFRILHKCLQNCSTPGTWMMLSRQFTEHSAKFLHRDTNIENFLQTLALAVKNCGETREEILKGFAPLCSRMIRDPWCAYHGSLCNLIRKLIETDNGEALVSLTRVHKVCDAEFALLLVQALREDCERKYEGRMRSVLLLIERLLVSERTCDLFVRAGALACFCEILSRQRCETELKHTLGCLRRVLSLRQAKYEFLGRGGLDLIQGILCEQGRSDTVIERALAVLVNASFRNKSVADILLNGHCFEIIMELMQLHSQCGSVQRQCCMLLRNCAMHGADVQNELLRLGSESLLRQCKQIHPNLCLDVASAALRDLGCTNHSEGWRPRTLVIGTAGEIIDTTEL